MSLLKQWLWAYKDDRQVPGSTASDFEVMLVYAFLGVGIILLLGLFQAFL